MKDEKIVAVELFNWGIVRYYETPEEFGRCNAMMPGEYARIPDGIPFTVRGGIWDFEPVSKDGLIRFRLVC